MYMIKIKILLNANFRNAQASKHALTKKQRKFILNFFNIRMTNKHMRVDETYVILGQYLQFS